MAQRKCCIFGFTEIMNNAIEHSGGWEASAEAWFDPTLAS